MKLQAFLLILLTFASSQAERVSIRSKACPVGTFEAGKACVPCPKGTFADVEGLSKCKNCPKGSESPKGSTSKSDCTKCFAGFFVKDGVCLPCPRDTFNEKDGSTECKPCPQGTISTKRATQCDTCPVGKLAVRKARFISCQNCPAGTTTIEATSEKCVPCPIGTFQNDRRPFRGTGKCKPCRPGTFSDERGLGSCKKCPKGFYMSGMGATSCIKCPKNSRTNGVGAKFCRPTCDPSTPGCISCPPGQGFYAEENKCMKCPAGTISSSNSTTPCYPCPEEGEGMVNKEQTACACEPGQRIKPDGTCQSCPFMFTNTDGGKCVCVVPELPDGRCACPEGERFISETNKCESPKSCPGDSVLNFEGKCKKCPADTFRRGDNLFCTCGMPGFGLRNARTPKEKCGKCQPGEEPITVSTGNRPTTIECNPCFQFTFNDMAGATKCRTCPKGQRPLKEGAKSCLEPCPANAERKQDFFEKDETCKCKFGFINVGGADLDVKCEKCGQNEVIFRNKCVCPSGIFTGDKVCVKCPKNSFELNGRCRCNCGFIKDKKTGKCEACPAGTESVENRCEPCASMEIAPNPGTCVCDRCKVGLVAVEGIKCLRQCTKGFFRNKKFKCVACRKGQRVVDRECEDCPTDSVSLGGNVEKCTKCKGGKIPNKDKDKCVSA